MRKRFFSKAQAKKRRSTRQWRKHGGLNDPMALDFWNAITKPAKEETIAELYISEIGLFHVIFDYKIEALRIVFTQPLKL
jgi:hypothetical protein